MATNGKDGNGKDKIGDIVDFPTLAERDRLRKKKEAEEAWRRETRQGGGGNKQPFFNFGRIPPLTRALVVVFFLIQLVLSVFFDAGERLQLYYQFGFVSAIYSGGMEWRETAWLAPFTHLFIHGNWLHLAFNTVMMLAMGVFTEKMFGARRMAIFFIFSGLMGALLYFLLNPAATAPLIGASGGISGLFGITFYTLYDQGQLGPKGKRGALPLILFWIALMAGTGLVAGDIAWQAHLGGFLGGLGLYHALRKGWIRF